MTKTPHHCLSHTDCIRVKVKHVLCHLSHISRMDKMRQRLMIVVSLLMVFGFLRARMKVKSVVISFGLVASVVITLNVTRMFVYHVHTAAVLMENVLVKVVQTARTPFQAQNFMIQ